MNEATLIERGAVQYAAHHIHHRFGRSISCGISPKRSTQMASRLLRKAGYAIMFTE